MSIVKELTEEAFQKRLDTSIKTAGSSMVQNLSLQGYPIELRDDMEREILSRLDDYFNHVASYDQREGFINEWYHPLDD